MKRSRRKVCKVRRTEVTDIISSTASGAVSCHKRHPRITSKYKDTRKHRCFHQHGHLRNNAGVKLVYLPPYSPDLNPIKEFFPELKAFIKRHWSRYEEDPGQGFDMFLEWCVDVVGGRECRAKGHFRHSQCGYELDLIQIH